jgi:hypothetical protein
LRAEEHSRRRWKRRYQEKAGEKKSEDEEKAKIIVDMANKRRNTRALSEVGYVFLSLQHDTGGF